VANGRPFEITTLRRDVESFGRHARIAFTDDWREDAARRDLTFNALSCRPDGVLFDYFGGLQDLAEGRVRFVGDARLRIAEDRLRLLRFFRFLAWYGRAGPDPEGLAAAVEAAPALARLSGERIQGEMLKLLAAPDPVPVLGLMGEGGVLAHAVPAALRLERLAALVAIEPVAGLPRDPVLRLGALLVPGPAGAVRVAERWRLSNADRDRLLAMAGPEPVLRPDLPPRAQRLCLYRLGPTRWADRVLVGWAETLADGRAGEPGPWLELLRLPQRWGAPKLPVKGRDLVRLGVKPGPEVGALIGALEAWWIDQDFAPDRQACLEWARARLGHPLPSGTGREGA
jgi:poly(A) polymerase